MLVSTNFVSCNFSTLSLKSLKPKNSFQIQNPKFQNFKESTSKFSPLLKPSTLNAKHAEKGLLQICHGSFDTQNSEEDKVLDKGPSVVDRKVSGAVKDERDWTTSILLFVLWGALMYYASIVAPNQTPTGDLYFLKKLLNLKGDDGFRMNQVIVSLWYIMGLWPLIFSMLLLPTGRSSNSKIPVWPFLSLSFFAGAYGLLPYFALWKPPPPPVEESELRKWPLNFLESKLTAGISLAGGVGLIVYAALADGSDWIEFYQYFRSSRFIHVMSLDFSLLSTFAPFWVYNDMTARKWYDKGWWLLPVSCLPFVGPALYLVLRPSLSEMPVSINSTSSSDPK